MNPNNASQQLPPFSQWMVPATRPVNPFNGSPNWSSSSSSTNSSASLFPVVTGSPVPIRTMESNWNRVNDNSNVRAGQGLGMVSLLGAPLFPGIGLNQPMSNLDPLQNIFPDSRPSFNPFLYEPPRQQLIPPETYLSVNASNIPSTQVVEKQPRLTLKGKRIGRPPGTFKYRLVSAGMETLPINDENGHFDCEWNFCPFETNSKRILVEHVEEVHIKPYPKNTQCLWAECTHVPFESLYQLTTHVRSHTKERPFICNFEGCTKEYSRLENLKTHRRTHTGEKPYSCKFPECDRTFTNASDRAKHFNRVHSEEKPYLCLYPGCDKCYTDPSSLRKHAKKFHVDYAQKTAHIPKFIRSSSHRNKNVDQVESYVPAIQYVESPQYVANTNSNGYTSNF